MTWFKLFVKGQIFVEPGIPELSIQRASGVLVVLLGPAVRLSEYVSASDKRYQAVVRLGQSTDTYDAEGRVTGGSSPVDITEEKLKMN
jgi:tRNA pseudouridine55 synthase